ncbi:sensor domain-containing diguanylate cyclase [Marinobacterium arenosum]|uniref:sensor domain-containing diguanylate cyclase n=1 Tax=Marinobacterium arenosum TaxID=2862496 RepID=UPI001C95D8A8|nr:sensor domain-containing diguanylate cyclase [Marinobacterium arenosum]MBY4675428.1 sensor domain-containing diguanylate cyclase [Marinobacterium arenosum]
MKPINLEVDQSLSDSQAAAEHYLKRELYELVRLEPAVFEFLQAGSLDGLWYWDIENPAVEWMSPSFWTLLGYDPAEKQHLAAEWQDIINPDDLQLALQNFEKHCQAPHHPYDQVVRYRHKDGSTVWVRCRGIAIRDANGKPIRMLGAHNDLTPLKRTEQLLREKNRQLEKLAREDYLTSLYNRRAFYEHFESQLRISIRERLPISIALIDIDHFKQINDSLGHQKGDEVLCTLARLLEANSRDSDTLARFGGEEFIVLMFDADRQDGLKAAERLRQCVEESAMAQTSLTVSIGVSSHQQPDPVSGDIDAPRLCNRIIAKADQALYRAKRAGRNKIAHFDDDTCEDHICDTLARSLTQQAG